jgi:hypothetical protein
MDVLDRPKFEQIVGEICALDWSGLSAAELTDAAWAYYHFSIQFRESLEAALHLHPSDTNLLHLAAEECDTANLSPWPGVAQPGEAMNHDEFMRRTLALEPLDVGRRARLEAAGERYLAATRALDIDVQARSIASYEDGGLEQVFHAMLRAPDWNTRLLGAFRHFLTEHIRFDSDPDAGHGALARHLQPDDRVLPLWIAFRDLFVACAPGLKG